MNIRILGSGCEVGRSAILLNDSKKHVMLDYGMKIEPPPPQYPRNQKTDAMILSHAHLDHSGAIPMLFKKSTPKIFMNDITLELSSMLIRDSIKVGRKEGYPPPFSKKHLGKMVKSTKLVRYNEKFTIGNMTFSLWQSGHIPGSASILANGKKKIFYTSDIQTIDSNLVDRCNLPETVDTLIIESTYGQSHHVPRKHMEKNLLDSVEEALANNEHVLLPVFAVGRAQEVMLILEKYASKIALDGMARQASEIVAEYGSYIKDAKRFRSILHRVKFIRSNEDRKKALEKYPIIISSAGMLGGGPAIHYLREISRRKASKVIFTGFLVEDTPGRNLIETSIFKNAEEEFNVHCELKQFSLSAHTDRKGIFEVIERTKPKTVVCVHGDNCPQVAKDIEEHFDVQAFAPKNGEEIRV